MDENKRKEIEEKISRLPSGGITYKKIYGKSYAYYQWSEGGKQHCRRVKDEELDSLSAGIAERKALQASLCEDKASPAKKKPAAKAKRAVAQFVPPSKEDYSSSVKTGDSLRAFIEPVSSWPRRTLCSELESYIYGESTDRVFIVCGLRRTGKTTILRHVICDMKDEDFSKTAFVQPLPSADFKSVKGDLDILSEQGYRYIFIDEATHIDDFSRCVALFGNLYASSGIKIILSGTDSLAFALASDVALYDRAYILDTSFIPFNDYAAVHPDRTIDDYLKSGGLLGGEAEMPAFSRRTSTDEYIKSAIVANISNTLNRSGANSGYTALKNLQSDGSLYSEVFGFLTHLAEDYILEVLSSSTISDSLVKCFSNYCSSHSHGNEIDTEILGCLEKMGVIKSISRYNMELLNEDQCRIIFSQPGLRYSLCKSSVEDFLADRMFESLSADERATIADTILNDIKDRLLIDLVLIETSARKNTCNVFEMDFVDDSVDMVISNPDTTSCELYCVSSATDITDIASPSLFDPLICQRVSHRCGNIEGKYIIYRGEDYHSDKAQYLNILTFLDSIRK